VDRHRIIDTSQPIQELASGFGGDLGPAEGPVWWKEGRYLLFSDMHNNRRMKFSPGQGAVELWRVSAAEVHACPVKRERSAE
jgi:sugar lactone lactonase YvrE